MDALAYTEAVEVALSDGRRLRWGPDEASELDVPLDIQFDTEIPGGFGPASITLPRQDLTRSTIRLFSDVRTYVAETGETLYEGRVTGFSLTSSTVSIDLEGWARHLEDDNTLTCIFVDQDRSKWTGASSAFKLGLEGSSNMVDPTVENDLTTGEPALVLTAEGAWAAGARPFIFALYDGGLSTIGSVYYAWKRGPNLNNADANWSWKVAIADVDSLTLLFSPDTTAELRAAGPGTGTLNGSAATRRFAAAWLAYGAVAAGTAKLQYSLRYTALAVYGDHGLTKQGTGNANVGPGLLASDIMTYIIARGAPLLNVEATSIEGTAFGITHLTFDEPTNARTMLEATNAFGGANIEMNDWGVYDDKTFFCKSPGSYGRTWRVRRDDSVESSDDGPDSQACLNGVMVRYDDGTGTSLTVGPPGSGADMETVSLIDTSTDNPANNDGARHWATYDVGITTQFGAILIGMVILSDAGVGTWRGSLSIHGTARTEAGVELPAGLIRAGDWIVVEDDYDMRPRKIVNTSYAGKTVSCSIGRRPDELDVLLARAGVALVART